MIKINIKPLSVNCAYRGRRFKTNEYKAYEEVVLLLLPKGEVPEGKIRLDIEFGFSNKQSDIDNPVKMFTDILQKKYGFNDRDIYELHVKKTLVKKKQEFIDFEISIIE